MIRDPVCGMETNPESAVTAREHMGQRFYFCSQSCVEAFDADPHRYAQAALAVPETSDDHMSVHHEAEVPASSLKSEKTTTLEMVDISITNITMRDIDSSPIFMRLGARLRGPKATTHPGTAPGPQTRIRYRALSSVTASACSP